ncbi:UPF0175 family protein [Foetidibacter luteolus]|uniref:UPF0175 family protein n=1 Tax=Foetidibacter luteolus TaxID=2608880 RepID=UPI00129B8DD8|nr:UPF0175 family protein [Foetidibacter luteolus]
MELILEIPDKFSFSGKLTKEDALLGLAIKMYMDEEVTLYAAAELANMDWFQFQKELASRKIPTIKTSITEIREQIAASKTIL